MNLSEQINMKLFKFYCCFVLVFFSSCGRKTLSVEDALGGSSSVTSGTLKITVSSALVESSPEVFVLQGQESFSGTATSPETSLDQEFNISIDEEILMFSKLKFEIEKTGDKNDCAVIYFKPYSYQKSSSTRFKPLSTGFDELNCSGFALVPDPPPDPLPPPVPIPVPPGCFGGPAKDMVTGFPIFNEVFVTTKKLIKEGKFTNQENNVDPRIDNRYYVNNLDVLNRDTTQPNLYVADTMDDYEAYCRDDFGNKLLSVKINISDFDGGDPNPDVDQYCTWSSGVCGL